MHFTNKSCTLKVAAIISKVSNSRGEMTVKQSGGNEVARLGFVRNRNLTAGRSIMLFGPTGFIHMAKRNYA